MCDAVERCRRPAFLRLAFAAREPAAKIANSRGCWSISGRVFMRRHRGPIWGTAYSCRAACRGPNRLPQSGFERLMRQHGIRAHAPMPLSAYGTTDSKHSLPVAANLLDRNFTADRAQSGLVGGYHLRPDRRRLASTWPWSSTCSLARSVGWSMREHMAALNSPLPPSPWHSSDAARGRGPDPSFGSRQVSTPRRRLPQDPAGRPPSTPSMSRKAKLPGITRRWRASSAP